jgi:hypothetical protein
LAHRGHWLDWFALLRWHPRGLQRLCLQQRLRVELRLRIAHLGHGSPKPICDAGRVRRQPEGLRFSRSPLGPLNVGKAGALVHAKVQPGNPSLNVGKAGPLIDANFQAGNPSLNIGGLKAAANTSASVGTQTNTSKTGANAGAKASLGVGQ